MHRHPGPPLTHRRSVTHAPPPPGPAQILHQNTEGDLECVSGGGAKPPTRQTVVIPLYFGGESGLGLGVEGACVTERRWVRGGPGRRFPAIRIDTRGNPSPIDAQPPMPPHPQAQPRFFTKIQRDDDCLPGGGALPPTTHTLKIALCILGGSRSGLGGGYGWPSVDRRGAQR